MARPEPRHIVAQQPLTLCLQEHRIGSRGWVQAWNGLVPFDRSAEPILRHLVDQGFVDQDGELLFIGPAAEQRFGYRHFMGMTAVFTARTKKGAIGIERSTAELRENKPIGTCFFVQQILTI